MFWPTGRPEEAMIGLFPDHSHSSITSSNLVGWRGGVKVFDDLDDAGGVGGPKFGKT